MRKLLFLVVTLTAIIHTLKAKEIPLQNSKILAEFSAKENYILTSLVSKDSSCKKSILKKMELIFHYTTSKGMYYIGESNTKNRFGASAERFYFKTTSWSCSTDLLSVKKVNQNFQIFNSFVLKKRSESLNVNYKIQAIKRTFLGPHSLCPAMTFELTEPLIIFPSRKIVNGKVQWTAVKQTSSETVQCRNWAVIYDKASNKGVLIAAQKAKIAIFRHKRIGSNQKPLWVAALKPLFLKGHYFAPNSKNTIALRLKPFSGEYEKIVHSQFNKSSSRDQGNNDSAILLKESKYLAAWSPATGHQITRKEPIPSGKATKLLIASAGNECTTTPILLRGKENMTLALVAEKEVFRSSNGKCQIPEDCITLNEAKWYNVKSSRYPESIIGEAPDSLTETVNFNVTKNENTLLWLKVRVPYGTPSGIYTSRIALKKNGKCIAEIPVELKVFDFSIPHKRSIPCWTPVWAVEMKKVYGSQKACNLKESFYKNLSRHRGGMWASYPALRFKQDSADIEYLQWGKFEKDLDLFFNKLKMPYAVCRIFRIGGAHHLIGTPYGKIKDMFSPLWIARYKKMAQIMKEYEKRKGIQGRLIYELYDEPYDKDYGKLIKCAQILRSVYPAIKLTFWSGRGVIPEMEKVINVWTVSNMSFNPALSLELQKQGKQVWIYNPIEFTDLSLPIGSTRRLFWYLWSKKVNGLFFWNITAWKDWGGIYTRPNRDSTLIYPGKNGPVNTIRWEHFRDGLEDYEYLKLLEKIIKEVVNDGSATMKDRTIANEASKFIQGIAKMDFTDTETIFEVENLRAGLVARIEKLKKYIPKEPKEKRFSPDKGAAISSKVLRHFTVRDFPRLNRKGKSAFVVSNTNKLIPLSSRLFSFDAPGSKAFTVAKLKLRATGTGRISPELFVRFAGIIRPASCKLPLSINSSKPKTYSFRFILDTRQKAVIQLKIILKLASKKSIKIDNLNLELEKLENGKSNGNKN